MEPTVNRFLLGVQYMGGRYNGSMHVGEYIRDALKRFIGPHFSNLDVSSRTDTGVHALRNVWQVDIRKEVKTRGCNNSLNRQASQIRKALNFYLRKEDILVTDSCPVPLDFECRRQAKFRTYIYRLSCSPALDFKKRNLFQHSFAWNVGYLDVPSMKRASQYLVGIHDFSSFRNAGCQSRSPFRHVWQIEVKAENPDDTIPTFERSASHDAFLLGGHRLVTVKISANAFVYRMVRNMVGTLVSVGNGEIAADEVKELLMAKDRQLLPAAAPAHGLFLLDVAYNDEELIVKDSL